MEMFKDDYDRVYIENTEYRVYGRFGPWKKDRLGRLDKAKVLYLIERALPFPITDTKRFWLHTRDEHRWSMTPVGFLDHKAQNRDGITKVKFVPYQESS